MEGPIDVQCPACGHLTQVPVDSVGRQARCRCGFTFEISAGQVAEVADDFGESAHVAHSTYRPGSGGNTLDGPPGASAPTWEPDDEEIVPPEIADLLRPDEEVVCAENPLADAVQLRMVLWLAGVGVPLLLWSLAAMAGGDGGGACLGMTCCGVLGVVLVVKYLGWRAGVYVITGQRTLVREGRLVKRISIVPHDAVLSISVETGLADRWNKTRSVRIYTATGGRRGGGVLLPHTAQADRIVGLLDQMRTKREDLL